MTKEIIRKQTQFRLKPPCAALLLAFAVQTAQANPIGAAVVNGQAGFATSGNTLTVTNTLGAIINWQGFSIGANEITRFAQQSASSSVLNRVISNRPVAFSAHCNPTDGCFSSTPTASCLAKARPCACRCTAAGLA